MFPTRTPIEKKSPELIQAEKDAKAALYAFFRAKAGRQAEVSRLTGIAAPTLSRMANDPETPISVEAAIALELATDGQMEAARLCPGGAELIRAWEKHIVSKHALAA